MSLESPSPAADAAALDATAADAAVASDSTPRPGFARRVVTAPARFAAWLRAEPDRLAALGVLLVGVAIRLWFLPEARFTGDEALFYEKATRAAWFEWFPWHGPAVTGGPLMHPGGTFYLLMSLPLMFTRSPLGPMALIVALNAIAYALIWATARRVAGPRAALLVLIALVFSPWSYFYSDRIWNSNVVLLPAALFFWAVVSAIRIPRSPRIAWAVFAVIIFPHFHLSVPLLIIVGLGLWALYRPPVRWRSAFWGVGWGVLAWTPYFVKDGLNGFHNTKLFLAGVTGKVDAVVHGARAVLGFLTLPTGEISYFAERGYWFEHDQWGYWAEGPGLTGMVDFFGGGAWGALLGWAVVFSVVLAALALLIFVARATVDLVRGRRLWRHNPLVPAFFLGIGAIVTLFLLSKKPYFPHYVGGLYPLAFVPLLVALEPLVRRRAVFVAALALFATLGALETAMTARYYRTVDAPVGVQGSREIVEAVHELGRDRTCRISFDIEKSRLNAGPLLRLAEFGYVRPIPHSRTAQLHFRVYSNTRFEQLYAQKPRERWRLYGRPVSGHRQLTYAHLLWHDPEAPRHP